MTIKFQPTWWGGLNISISTSKENRQFNRDFVESIHDWISDNNFLKNEKFAIDGEFIDIDSADDWDTVILSKDVEDPIRKMSSSLTTKGIEMPQRGMLFIGPPGTGKTKTGRIMMSQIDSTFIWVSSKDVERSWDIVPKIKSGFALARQLAPSVLFFEDIDYWITDNVVDVMKTELDGIRKNSGVITVLTTNNPENFPDSLIDRPGRFHDILNFDIPDDEIRSRMIKEWSGVEFDDEKLKEILDATEGFSGAYMWELMQFAKLVAEDDGLDIQEAILISLKKIESQKNLIRRIRGETLEEIAEEIVEEIRGDQEEVVKEPVEIEIIPEEKIEIEETKESSIDVEQLMTTFAYVLGDVLNMKPDVDQLVSDAIEKAKGRMYY